MTRPDTLTQIIWSRGCPVEFLLDVHQILLDVQQDSTGCPLEFCKFASKVLELPISSRNAIKNSTGCPVEILLDVLQNLRPVELLNWTSTTAEDLAECVALLVFLKMQIGKALVQVLNSKNSTNVTNSKVAQTFF